MSTARKRVTFNLPLDDAQVAKRTRRLPEDATGVAFDYTDTNVTVEYEWAIHV